MENNEELTLNDKVLIQEAQDLDYIDWMLIKPENADTELAKRILKNIQSKYLHREEYFSGNL